MNNSSMLDKLYYLEQTKSDIREKLVSRGISVPYTTPFREYANLMDQLNNNEEIERLEQLLQIENESKLKLIFTLNSKFGIGLNTNSTWDEIITRIKGIIVYKLFCNASIKSKINLTGFSMTSRNSTSHRLMHNNNGHKYNYGVKSKINLDNFEMEVK